MHRSVEMYLRFLCQPQYTHCVTCICQHHFISKNRDVMNLWFISGSVESKAKGVLFKRSLLLPLKLDRDFLNNISKYMETRILLRMTWTSVHVQVTIYKNIILTKSWMWSNVSNMSTCMPMNCNANFYFLMHSSVYQSNEARVAINYYIL